MTVSQPSAADAEMRSYIQRVATGPELSKDLARAEAASGMRLILERRADPVQAAIYLIALRMKRETEDEEAGTLDALLEAVDRQPVAVDDLVDVADPYDGFVRGTPASSFLPAVLAALGVPASISGARAVGPKYGVTHHMVLEAAGVDVLMTPREAARCIEDDAVGWSYIDQRRFIPALHDLLDLRTLMVKRTVLTTLEVLLCPLRAKRSHLMTGYVHKPYPPRYLRLARQAGYASAMIVRGVEGGVIPSLSQASKFFRRTGAEDREVRLAPDEIGIDSKVRIEPLPDTAGQREPAGQPFASIDARAVAAHAARVGEETLRGARGAFRDGLVYGASICLTHLGRCRSMEQAARRARKAIDDGLAFERFKAARRRDFGNDASSRPSHR